MVRTQVYLTEEERKQLAALAKTSGKKQSELIRDAVDELLDRSSLARRHAALEALFGIWKDRTDLPDFEEIRRSADRDFG